MLAKIILKRLCETALLQPRPYHVTETIEHVTITLHMQTFTDGIWTIRSSKDDFTTDRITEAEIVLNSMLTEKVGAA